MGDFYVTPEMAKQLRQTNQIDDRQYNEIIARNQPPEALPSVLSPDQTQALKQSNQPLKPSDQLAFDKKVDASGSPVEPTVSGGTTFSGNPNQSYAKPASLSTDGSIDGQQPSANNPFQKMMTDMDKPYDMMTAAALQGAKIGAAKGAEASAVINQGVKDQQNFLAANESARVQRSQELDDQFSKIQKDTAEVSNMKIDPNKFWAERSTGDKVLAGIAMFLGAAGGAVNGGQNSAVPVIQNAINRDIDAQKANIGVKQDALTQERGLYSQKLNTYKDRDLADMATQAAYWQNVQNQVQGLNAKYMGPESQANAMNLLGQIEEKKQSIHMQMAQRLAALQPVTPETNMEMVDPEKRVRSVRGYYGSSNSPKEAEDVRTAKTSNDKVGLLVDDLESMSKSLSPKTRNDAEVKVNALNIALKDAFLGNEKMTETARKFLDDMNANPTKVFSVGAIQTLKSMKQVSDMDLRVKRNNAGFYTQDDLDKKRMGINQVSYKK